MHNFSIKQKSTRLFVQVMTSVLLIYGVLWNNQEAPDIHDYYFVWLEHIRSSGPVGAFSSPFGNYAPPYLYLLDLASLLGLAPLSTVKLISVLGTLFLGWAIYRLLTALEPKRALEAGLFTLLLPTVIINAAFLGQCDAWWTACCVLAVTAAVERRNYAMVTWAAAGFAFKAQAIFIAPFCLAIVLRERKWSALAIPPAVYLLAVAPAWAAGWPLDDLLLIYARQFDYVPWLSTAPNLWALPQLLLADQFRPPTFLLVVAYTITAIGVVAYLWRFPRPLIAAALLSVMLVAWPMPKIHERYFLITDVLSLAYAFVDRRAVVLFLCSQVGSLLSLMAYIFVWQPFNSIGSLFMTAGFGVLLWISRWPAEAQKLVPSAGAGAAPTGTAWPQPEPY